MKLKVLIVDDDEDICDLFRKFILAKMPRDVSYQVESMTDSHKALDALLSQSYDLLLTDIDMPGISGTELISVLRKEKGPNQNIPALMISGFPERCLDQLISKNYDNILLLDKPVSSKTLKNNLIFASSMALNQKVDAGA